MNEVKKCQNILGRELLEIEINYLQQYPKEKLLEIHKLINTLTKFETMNHQIWKFIFFMDSQQAEKLLNENNHINIFLVRFSVEENELKIFVTIKSNKSQGKPQHIQYYNQIRDGGPTKLIDRNILASLKLIDLTSTTNMLIIVENSIYSVCKELICGR